MDHSWWNPLSHSQLQQSGIVRVPLFIWSKAQTDMARLGLAVSTRSCCFELGLQKAIGVQWSRLLCLLRRWRRAECLARFQERRGSFPEERVSIRIRAGFRSSVVPSPEKFVEQC